MFKKEFSNFGILVGLYIVANLLQYVMQDSYFAPALRLGEYAVVLGFLYLLLKGRHYLQQLVVTVTLIVGSYEYFRHSSTLMGESKVFLIANLPILFVMAVLCSLAFAVLVQKTIKKFNLPIELH